MVFQLSKIISDARVAIGANPRSQQPWLPDADSPQLELDDALLRRVEGVAAEVVMAAPLALLGEGHIFADSICWHEPCVFGEVASYSGYTLLPDDFMRLIAFQMDDWALPATAAIMPGDPAYSRQRSPYPGLRGCPQRPVCAIVNRQEGKALEFFSCRSPQAMPARALYAPWPRIADNAIDLPEQLYPAFIRALASATNSNPTN